MGKLVIELDKSKDYYLYDSGREWFDIDKVIEKIKLSFEDCESLKKFPINTFGLDAINDKLDPNNLKIASTIYEEDPLHYFNVDSFFRDVISLFNQEKLIKRADIHYFMYKDKYYFGLSKVNKKNYKVYLQSFETLKEEQEQPGPRNYKTSLYTTMARLKKQKEQRLKKKSSSNSNNSRDEARELIRKKIAEKKRNSSIDL